MSIYPTFEDVDGWLTDAYVRGEFGEHGPDAAATILAAQLAESNSAVELAEFAALAIVRRIQERAEVELLQAEVDRERGKVGNLVREVEALRAELDMPTDITPGQLSSWPPAAFTAVPPLPRRNPMQAAFDVGEFPAIVQPAPMTDPALEDRTEGEQPTDADDHCLCPAWDPECNDHTNGEHTSCNPGGDPPCGGCDSCLCGQIVYARRKGDES